MPWCTIIGLAVGVWLSYTFILPSNVLDLKLAAMTISDLLRIFAALAAPFGVAAIGHIVDICLGNA
jgi:hypothetical protein